MGYGLAKQINESTDKQINNLLKKMYFWQFKIKPDFI